MLGHILIMLSPFISLIMMVVIIITEILLLKEIRKNNGEDSIWLALNILLPVLGFILYKLSHKKKKKNKNFIENNLQ